MDCSAFRAEAGVQTFQLPDNCFTLKCCLTCHFFCFWPVKLTFIAAFYGTEQNIILTCGCPTRKTVAFNVGFFQGNIATECAKNPFIDCQISTDFFTSKVGIQG